MDPRVVSAMRVAALSLAVSLAACGGTAYRVTSADRPSATQSVVIGKMGFPGPGEAIDDAKIYAVDAAGKRWKVEFDLELSQDGRRTAPFFVRLPPGQYRLQEWEILFPEIEWMQADTGLTIQIEPNRTVCVGAMYVSPRMTPGGTGMAGVPDVKNECDELAKLLVRRAPQLGVPPPAVSLASPGG